MEKAKKYFYTYEQTDEGKNAETMVEEILGDPALTGLEEIIIGNWGECWDDETGCQRIIDMFCAHSGRFAKIRRIFIGDMDVEECEVSWIYQGNYAALWEALPLLEGLTIKGSQNLSLGTVAHERLKSLEIICGGLPVSVLSSIAAAKLPNLEKLNLYIGVDGYGFDGNQSHIEALLGEMNFPQLRYLGLNDSDIQDEIAELILNSRYAKQLETLDLSNGTLTDRGGSAILAALPNMSRLTRLDLHYHYLSEEMMARLSALPLEVDVSNRQEADEDEDEVWRYPMLTE